MAVGLLPREISRVEKTLFMFVYIEFFCLLLYVLKIFFVQSKDT